MDIVKTDAANVIYSRHFHIQIKDEADLEKIQLPVVRFDANETERRRQLLDGVFGDLLPVVPRGARLSQKACTS